MSTYDPMNQSKALRIGRTKKSTTVGKAYRHKKVFSTTPLLVEIFFGEPTYIINLLMYLN